jgi:hypothetical protein
MIPGTGGLSRTGNSIYGTITDSNGAVIPNASVTIRNAATQQTVSLRTDDDGSFSSSSLSSGLYTVTVSSSGFQTTVMSNIQVTYGESKNINFTLEPGNVSATVEVTSSSSVGSSGSGSGSGVLSNYMRGGGAETSVSDLLIGQKSGVETAATGEEIGDLFEYRIEQPVTVLRDRSALIPIVQTKMDGERVSIFNEDVREDRPLSGMLLKNTTSLTLENGSLTVIDRDAYAGEALMERLKPKEQRLISFALDLGTSVTVSEEESRAPAKLIKAVDGVLQVHYFKANKKVYRLVNQSEREKIVYIEHPVEEGWELSEDTAAPAITTEKYYRFRVVLAPFAKVDLPVTERQGLVDSYQIGNLNRNDLELFVSRRYIDEKTRATLEKFIDLHAQINQIERNLQAFKAEEEKISDDQKRLRENIEALSKTPEAKTLIERYIAKANEQETRLEQIERDRKTLEKQKLDLEIELGLEIRKFSL